MLKSIESNTTSKIYKYASIDSALKILKDDRLLLTNPSVFNDPFDNNCKRDPKDIKKVSKIETAFKCATILANLLQDPLIGEAVKNNKALPIVKKEYEKLVSSLKVYPRFDGNFVFTALHHLLGLKSDAFKEQAEKRLRDLEEQIEEGLQQIKRDALVTCFSKTNKSILMWSHYADGHKGVCIEYDRPESSDFVDVIYRKHRPKVKLAELVSFYAAWAIVGDQYNHQLDQKLVLDVLEPYIVKSLDWKYEQEVRCLTKKDSQSPNVISDKKMFYYQMMQPTKIYIGCKARGKMLIELIKMAKKRHIKCIFLKIDNDAFELVEK